MTMIENEFTGNGQGNGNFKSTYESSSIKTNRTTRSLIETHQRLRGDDKLARRGKRERFKQFIVVALFLIGLIICVTSLVCIILLPTFVSKQISERLVLKNNSLLLERWSKPNVPMYFKVWVFNVKNAQSIVDQKNIKPELEEIGPFVFHLKRQKDVISFAGENLYYTERKVYHFAPELSCCAINTTVTIPNIPLAAVVDRALSYNLPLVGRFIPRLINRAIQSLREQLFVRKQVREILFDGYEVELLKMVSRVGSFIGMQPPMSQKFALLKGRNDTWRPEQDGVWAINTGAKDRSRFGRVTSWNSYKQLPFWAAPNCNLINGSDGTLFPPPIKKTEPLYIFNQELCRTVNLVYDRPSDIRSIKALRYVLNPLNFAHTMKGTGGSAGGLGLNRATSVLGSRISFPTTTTTTTTTTNRPISNLTSVVLNGLLVAQPINRTGSSTAGNFNVRQRQPVATATATTTTTLMTASPQMQPLVAADASESADLQQAPPPGDGNGRHATRLAQERHIQLAQDANAASKRSKMNPNTCFCDRKTTNLNGLNVCEFDGLIDLSKCTKQAQVIFGSMPHFYQSDARLLRQVVGLSPNASKHTTYLDIEPNTGLVLGGKRRVQLNLILKHNNEIDGFENINDMMIPVVWFEESALIPEESARKFRTLYTDRIRIINITLVSLLLASVVLLIIDTRLMIASQYWRKFKVNHSSLMSHLASPTARTTITSTTGNGYSKQEKPQLNDGDGIDSIKRNSFSNQIHATPTAAPYVLSTSPDQALHPPPTPWAHSATDADNMLLANNHQHEQVIPVAAAAGPVLKNNPLFTSSNNSCSDDSWSMQLSRQLLNNDTCSSSSGRSSSSSSGVVIGSNRLETDDSEAQQLPGANEKSVVASDDDEHTTRLVINNTNNNTTRKQQQC